MTHSQLSLNAFVMQSSWRVTMCSVYFFSGFFFVTLVELCPSAWLQPHLFENCGHSTLLFLRVVRGNNSMASFALHAGSNSHHV